VRVFFFFFAWGRWRSSVCVSDTFWFVSWSFAFQGLSKWRVSGSRSYMLCVWK
jgi:hypothetical protein